MPYATPDDMIARFDVRTLGDHAADGDTRVSAADLVTNAKMIAMLADASGQVNAACLQGERYSVEDLGGLTGDSAAFLVRLTCDIAFGHLWRRRPYTDDNEARAEAIRQADDHLTRLRDGEWVFDVAENKEAGRAKVIGVRRSVVSRDWKLVADRVRGKLYPRRRSFQDR